MSSRRAVLLVDHGSRREEANRQLEELAGRVRRALPDREVAIAHLEIAPPSIAEAIESLVARGASEIVVHPFFLAPGRHVLEDVPRLAREAGERLGGVAIRMGPPLGLHDCVVEAVVARIEEAERS